MTSCLVWALVGCVGPAGLGPPVVAPASGPRGGQALRYHTVEVVGSSAWVAQRDPRPEPHAIDLEGSLLYLTADSLLEIGPVGYAGAHGIGVGVRARFPLQLGPSLWLAPGAGLGMAFVDFALPLTVHLGAGHLLHAVAGHRFHSRGSFVPASVGWAWLSRAGHGVQLLGTWALVSVGDRVDCWQPYCEAGRNIARVSVGYLRNY